MPGSTSLMAVISAAIDDFNHGRQDALSASGEQPAALPPQALLGCSASRTCAAQRPIPLVAGTGELSLTEIREVGGHRAICDLTTADGTRLVGLYTVDDGRITAACHYFSDVDMLTELDVLPLTELPSKTDEHGAPTAVAARGQDARAPLSLGDTLLEARLAHRQYRLRLAIRALDLRVDALGMKGVPTPRALTAAIRGFQQELDDVRARQPRPNPTRQRPTTPEPESANHPSALSLDEVYPGTTLVGSCCSCRQLLFDREPHEWAHENTYELCMPHDDGAALYCGTCSNRLPAVGGLGQGTAAPATR